MTLNLRILAGIATILFVLLVGMGFVLVRLEDRIQNLERCLTVNEHGSDSSLRVYLTAGCPDQGVFVEILDEVLESR